jgi:thiamine-phosphate pyrophosphorylase
LKLDKKTLQLYAITDRTWLDDRNLRDDVQKAIDGGITFLQMREKSMTTDEFMQEAMAIKSLTNKNNIPFVINDNIDVALEINADGVHIGQDDIPVPIARKILGNDKILGVSAHTLEQALKAEKEGADYIGVGAIFTTSTKDDASNVSIATLKAICSSVNIPVVAIGGITADNALKLQGTGISGICVISAIFGASDIENATCKLKQVTNTIINN